MNTEKTHKLDQLFHPRSIAVVGASTGNNRQAFGGNSLILGSIRQNFNGYIYPKGVDIFCRNMTGAKEQSGKPMAFVIERDTDLIRSNLMAELEKRFREDGLMVFPTFDLAAKALVNLNLYHEHLLNQG